MSSIILSIPSSLPAGKTCPSATAVAPITATNDPNFFADNSACTLQSQLKLATYSAGVTDYINGHAGLLSSLGQAARFTDQTLFFPKIDWQINGRTISAAKSIVSASSHHPVSKPT
jgi:hypothetical protein